MAICIARLFGGVPSPGNQGNPAMAAWELQDLTGKTVHSTDFAGRVVVLDFWATWCGPCRAEIPALVALQKKYEKQGLTVVGISVDEAGAAPVNAFVQRTGINYPVVLADERVQQAFGGIEAIPTIFIIDRQGRLAAKHVGLTGEGDLEGEIKPLLGL